MELDRLLEEAKRRVTRCELKGGDWQDALEDIRHDPMFAPLFEGLDFEEEGELCKEISMGSSELEWEQYLEDKDY